MPQPRKGQLGARRPRDHRQRIEAGSQRPHKQNEPHQESRLPILTPEAKQLLSKAIRDLRARLLQDLQSAADRRYRLSLPLDKAALTEEPRKERERLEAWLDERVRTTHPKTA
jgi:hypothetical protein